MPRPSRASAPAVDLSPRWSEQDLPSVIPCRAPSLEPGFLSAAGGARRTSERVVPWMIQFRQPIPAGLTWRDPKLPCLIDQGTLRPGSAHPQVKRCSSPSKTRYRSCLCSRSARRRLPMGDVTPPLRTVSAGRQSRTGHGRATPHLRAEGAPSELLQRAAHLPARPHGLDR